MLKFNTIDIDLVFQKTRSLAMCFWLLVFVIKDLDLALKESTARWKVVVGHHTIRSVSIHGDTIELQSFLLPILKVISCFIIIIFFFTLIFYMLLKSQKNGVDFYVNGHDHCLEHISSNDW